MVNPVLKLIIKKGLNPRMFSVTYGCSFSVVRNTIYGYVDRVPKSVKSSLERCGFDVSNLDMEYNEWLKYTFNKEGA